MALQHRAPASAKARTVPNQKPADVAGPPLDLQVRARHLINCDLRFIAKSIIQARLSICEIDIVRELEGQEMFLG